MTMFKQKLAQASQRNNSLVCVGLDPSPDRLPAAVATAANPVLEFNRRLIDATADLVCCYKPNFAFYGALGASGWEALQGTLAHVPEHIPVILDAKVGDIGSTAERYAVMFFETLGADALTVTPYMGGDAVSPFLAYKDKGVFLVCLTSNAGADDFEKQLMGDRPLYERVVEKAKEWNVAGNCGLVAGATQPEHIADLRALAPDMPFLIPGIGAQGGDLQAAVKHGMDGERGGILINSSRGIMYASSGDDFAEAARGATLELRDQINACRA
jgi:orotidine 5'-phosphate decarboxylase subfamily 2